MQLSDRIFIFLAPGHPSDNIPSPCHEVSQLDDHIGIHLPGHRNDILLGLVKVIGYLMIRVSIPVEIGQVAYAVGAF